MINQTFGPAYGSGSINPTSGTSARVACGKDSKSLTLTNLGSVTVYVKVDGSSVVATTADYPVLPTTQVSISKANDHTHVAFISPDGAGSIHVMGGEGI
jgi:hypothetical protein